MNNIFNKDNIRDSFLSLILFILVLLPLVSMVINIDMSDFKLLFVDPNISMYLKNSIISALIASIISILIAFFISYEINFTINRSNKYIEYLLLLPMLLPSISISISLLNLFGYSGIISTRLNYNFDILGLRGIILAFVVYTLPISYIMISNGMAYIDRDLYIISDSLNISKYEQFKIITLKSMKPTLIATFFAVFTIIFTDYGIPMSIGGRYKTLSVYMYEEVIGMFNYSKGYILSLILIIPAIFSYIFSMNSSYQGSIGDQKYGYSLKKNKFIRVIIYIIVTIIILLIGSFLLLVFTKEYPYNLKFTFEHFKIINRSSLFELLGNSVLVSTVTGLIGVILAFISAYIVENSSGNISKRIIHAISLLTLTIPGLIIGMSYLYFYRSSAIYGGYMILIMVNLVHFLGSPYLMFQSAFKKIDRNYINIVKVFNIPEYRYIIDILVPLLQDTILDGFVYLFTNSMVTISAVTFLFTQDTKPISLELNTFMSAQMNYAGIALVSIMILLTNLTVRFIVMRLKKYNDKELLYDKK